MPDAEDAEGGIGEDDITIRFEQFRELANQLGVRVEYDCYEGHCGVCEMFLKDEETESDGVVLCVSVVDCRGRGEEGEKSARASSRERERGHCV